MHKLGLLIEFPPPFPYFQYLSLVCTFIVEVQHNQASNLCFWNWKLKWNALKWESKMLGSRKKCKALNDCLKCFKGTSLWKWPEDIAVIQESSYCGGSSRCSWCFTFPGFLSVNIKMASNGRCGNWLMCLSTNLRNSFFSFLKQCFLNIQHWWIFNGINALLLIIKKIIFLILGQQLCQTCYWVTCRCIKA